MSNETHHDFSPSSLEMFNACPWAYENRKRLLGESSKEASRGTMLHLAIHSDDTFSTLNEGDRAMIANIREIHVKPYVSLEHHFEKTLELRDGNGDVLTYGTPDFFAISPDGKHAVLKDWKFGGAEVTPARYNPQIQTYAAMIFQAYPDLEELMAMIVQPVFQVADFENEETLFSREDTIKSATACFLSARDRCLKATEDDARVTRFCKYCSKATCRAWREKMQSMCELMSVNAEGMELPLVPMTVEYADMVLLAEKAITEQMKLKSDMARKVILENGGSDSFRVANGRTTKRTDWKGLCEEKGITEDDVARFTTATQGEPYLMPKRRG